MRRPDWAVYIAVVLAATGCTAEPEPEESTPAPNPIERGVEPVRRQVTEADSAMRAREQAVQELTGGSGTQP